MTQDWQQISDTLIGTVLGEINRVVVSRVLSGPGTPLSDLMPELLLFIKMIRTGHERPRRRA